jgi:hypothetical protein
MRFRHTDIARMAQISGADHLRNRAFHASAFGILPLERSRCLSLAGGLQGFVLVAGADR